METPSERKLREELEATKRQLHDEQLRRSIEQDKAEAKAWSREQKAADNTAQIVLFGGIALAFALLLFK